MRNGRPNWNYVVCNGAGNLYVFGWFLVWLSFSAVSTEQGVFDNSSPHLPIFLNLRSAMSFLSCITIVGLTVATEVVTDEYDDFEEGLGAVGRLFGRFSELALSLAFMTAFAVYGACSFFPSESTSRLVFDSVVVILCIIQGRAYGLLFQKAIPHHDAHRWSRLGRIILIVFSFLVVFQSFTGPTSSIYTMIGAGLILWGHKHMMDDRKKGKLFLDTGKPNAAPLVYSFGPVFASLGWIFMAVAMSIPQEVVW